MALENRGVPTVVICTEPFLNSALVHAKTFGKPDSRPVTISHPLGGIEAGLVMERAASIRDRIVAVLTNGG
jgi:hypothetical protein